ncbi:hypothetical protein DES44_3661 [Roseateles depolymerans]|uniref:Uncharacterized protein n=1 Tax=Roseateles depolymerans TaxID=76731 RepID=A0A0U2TXA6_9BURK|nr:hypothetical protein RD2015_330 [Roseateles depolymerans]REG15155.1 hypothetical protein DES44_3661 [Roseateles depolymerans]
MKQETIQHDSPAAVSDPDAVVVELSLEDIASVSGGPQITNDSFQPPS